MSDTLAAALRSAGAGTVLTPGEAGFDAELACFNLASRHAPDAVVAARHPGDVAAAVRVARDTGTPLTVLGLGHGMPRDTDGGILVSTRGLAGVSLDLDERLVRVGAGTPWKEVLETVTPHGLAVLCGSSPEVGVVGYVLGGGLGPIARSYGFAADHVQEIQVVTPAHGLVTASPLENPELFWALRGGKSGLGIVTSITLDVFPIEAVYGGSLFYAAEDARAVLDRFATWSAALPLCASASIALVRLPPLPELPEALRGRFVATVRFAALDDAVRGEEILAPLREVATPILDTVGPLSYGRIGEIHADPTTPMPTTDAGMLLTELAPATVEALWAMVGAEAEVPLIAAELRTLGGRIAEQPSEPNAVSGRGAAYGLFLLGVPVPELLDTVIPQVMAGVFAALEPWRHEELLANFVGRGNGSAAWERVWAPETAARLDAVRRAVDPDGVLSPAPTASATPASA